MAALKAPLKEFEQAVATAAAKDEFALEVDRYDMAIIASQICAYRSKFKEQEMQFGLDRTPLADVGTKVVCDITVAKCVYSQNYNIYYVSGVATKENKMVRFTQSSKMEEGLSLKIKGKVKGYTDGTTVLHYVKAA